ncbi:MAG: spore maturation protein [Magnetospirillum sp. WYHS-4]
MNVIFVILVLAGFGLTAVRQIAWDGAGGKAPMDLLGAALVEAARSAVELSIGLVGIMALFLGLMKVAEAGGLLVVLAKALRPLMNRLFPEVPPGHPAMGAMVLNMSANTLGLGNAATPFGIRAMQELDRLNPAKGIASDAMVLFMAINTANVTLVPTSVIALRAAAGSADPAGVVGTTLFATLVATGIAILAAKLMQGRWRAAVQPGPAETLPPPSAEELLDPGSYPAWVSWLLLTGVLALVPVLILNNKAVSPWILPGLVAGLVAFGAVRKVKVYESFVEGAKDGFQVAVRIIPYLVAILAAVALFRASGALDAVIGPLGRLTTPFGLPPEAVTLTLLRSLTGSGAYGYLASLLQDPAIGPDSYTGYLASTIYGSTETTFYVLAVYFGAVGVRKVRHAVAAALLADLAGALAAVLACKLL